MAYFDRFDICAAYDALECDWNQGGHIPARTSRQHGTRSESIGVQLHRMGYRASPFANGSANLSDNAREIYALACDRLRLGDGGYKPCAVPDCMETAIGWGAPLCLDCQENGCGERGSCDCPTEDFFDELNNFEDSQDDE